MVWFCCAFGCKEKFSRNGPYSFHSFPKDEIRRKAWTIALKRENFTPSSHTKICSKHFSEECFDRAKFGGRWLKSDALPTIFEFPDHLQKRPLKPRKPPTKRSRPVSPAVSEQPTVKKNRMSSSSHGGVGTSLKISTSTRESGTPPGTATPIPGSETPIPGSETPIRGSETPIPECLGLAPTPESGTPTPTECQTPKKQRRPRMYRYFGDFKEDDFKSPRKCKLGWTLARNLLQKHNKRLKMLNQKNRRLQKKVTSLTSIVDYLKKKSLISDAASETLLMTLPDSAKNLVQRAQDGSTREKYPPALRCFALTLHFYSSKAYDYVRKTFNSGLPHPTTLRKWYQSVSGKPGFTQEALAALKIKVTEAAAVNKKVVCSMIMDEMAIRRHVEWDGNKFKGYVDYGTGLDDDNLPVAKEALVFMLNAVNGNWKIPVGYFLIDGLGAAERANLVNESLTFLYETGVEIVSLTFDGTGANISMANMLGARLHWDNLHTKFQHPVSGKDIYVILDACHMLKLIRNTLASKGSIVDKDGGIIKWDYIVKLEKYQNEQGLVAATKIRKRHIEWQREKMKVKIAAQTFSTSVANALEFLSKDLKIKEFDGCQPTVNFIRRINNLFDILNSRNLLSRGFKSPLKPSSEHMIIDYLKDSEIYLKGLRTSLEGQPILETNRKTGFLGFLVCINSVQGIYDMLVKSDDAPLKFLLTYKLSQDHLEVFFCAVRSKGGHNNNPTAKQFESAYKRLIVHHELSSSSTANCLVLDTTTILHVSSSNSAPMIDPYMFQINRFSNQKSINIQDSEPIVIESAANLDHNYSIPFNDPSKLSMYNCDIVGYISAFVARKLLSAVNCEECVLAIQSKTNFSSHSSLLNRKNLGGLVIASDDVFHICKTAESCYRVAKAMGRLRRSNVMFYLVTNSLNNVRTSVFKCLADHVLDQEPLDNHKIFLIKSVLYQYFRIRLNHEGKCVTEELQRNKVRSINTKLVLFQGH